MTRVYVGNLTEKIKKDDLEGEFIKYGKLNSVWIAFNPPGFAFVEFENRIDAEKSCELNGTELLGSQLRVEISKGKPRRRSGPGGGPDRNRRGGGGSSGGSGGYGSFRPRSSSSSRYHRGDPYNGRDGGGGRSFGNSGGGGGGGGGGYGRSGGRDSYNRDRTFSSSGSYGRSGRSGGSSSQDGGRYRSRSPAGNHRF